MMLRTSLTGMVPVVPYNRDKGTMDDVMRRCFSQTVPQFMHGKEVHLGVVVLIYRTAAAEIDY